MPPRSFSSTLAQGEQLVVELSLLIDCKAPYQALLIGTPVV